MIWNKPGQESERDRDRWQSPSKRPQRGRGKGNKPEWPSWLRRGGRFLRGPGSLSGLALVLVLVWLGIGGYVSIDQAQVGVVSRLGRYQRTLDPGRHFKWPPPFETVQKVDLGRMHSLSDSVQVLTRDQNLVEAAFTIQYRITDPRRYLFALVDVNAAMADLGQVAVKTVLARSAKQDLENADLTQLSEPMREQLQQALEPYRAGLKIEAVELSRLVPPDPVSDMSEAWASVQENNRVQADAAHNYAAEHLPAVRAAAAERVATARSDQTLRLQQAQAQVDRFDALLQAYRAAPAATRHLLWQDTVVKVLAANTKIVDDTRGQSRITVAIERGGMGAAAASSLPLPAVSATVEAAPKVGGELQSPSGLEAPTAKTDGSSLPPEEPLR